MYIICISISKYVYIYIMYKYVITCKYIITYSYIYIITCYYIYIHISMVHICNNPYTHIYPIYNPKSYHIFSPHAIPKSSRSPQILGLGRAQAGTFLLGLLLAVLLSRGWMFGTNEPLVMSGAEIWQRQLISTGIQNGMILSGKLT